MEHEYELTLLDCQDFTQATLGKQRSGQQCSNRKRKETWGYWSLWQHWESFKNLFVLWCFFRSPKERLREEIKGSKNDFFSAISSSWTWYLVSNRYVQGFNLRGGFSIAHPSIQRYSVGIYIDLNDVTHILGAKVNLQACLSFSVFWSSPLF